MRTPFAAAVFIASAKAIKNKAKIQNNVCEEPLDCLAETNAKEDKKPPVRVENYLGTEDRFNPVYGAIFDAEEQSYFDCIH